MEKKELVAVISPSDSFLARSLISKIEAIGFGTFFSHGNIKEIEPMRDSIELFIYFSDGDIEEMTETLVYLKDLANDLDKRFIIVSESGEHDPVFKVIPDHLVYAKFSRPLVMDELVKSISTYMEANTGENAKKTVLIVDDDLTYMRTVYEWLKEDYHVGMASNGVQAISYLARNKADLVLLDYEMPVANGPQVLQMLKDESETGHIPVMFLTSHGDRESVLSVAGLRPADYLLKTIDKPKLLEKLKSFFSK